MNSTRRKVNIIGHCNPDTDSICSAIAYAWLKNQVGNGVYEARRAGHINRETAFVLKHFGVEPPRLCTTVSPQIKDIDIRTEEGISGDTSLHKAWERMRQREIDTLCIVNEEKELQGLITLQDIATANMNLMDTGVLAASHTGYASLMETLNAQMLVGDPTAAISAGHIIIGTSPETMEGIMESGDIVLVTNRYEVQMYAVDCDASCIIACAGAQVSKAVIRRASEKGCAILTTELDTFAVSRVISTAAPVSYYMLRDDIIKFNINTGVEDASRVMAGVRLHYFPILDENGKYCGVISRRNLLNLHRKQVIMVDHNERGQAVSGLEEADILEIIDHHRIGGLETGNPVYFRNMPVGCTATIIYTICCEYGITPDRQTAGLLLSAILSDTLMFRSPTSTKKDEDTAKILAEICGENIPEYAQAMFEAGGDLTGCSAEDVFHSDFKLFSRGDVRFGVGQSTYMTDRNRLAAEELVGPYLPEAMAKQNLPLLLYMFTDAKRESTDLFFCGSYAQEIVETAFHVKAENGIAHLPGVVSRKKQLIPPVMAALQDENRQK